MPTDLDETLSAFHERSTTVRLVRTVCSVVPFAPALADWYSLVDGLRAIEPAATRPVLERARALAAQPDPQHALWLIGALDTADTGIGVFTGVHSAVRLYNSEEGRRLEALESDPQQAVDAVLKGLAIGALVHRLFEGGVAERVQAFRETDTGRVLLFYYAAIELGLPFADNALTQGGSVLGALLDRFGGPQQERLAAAANPEEAASAMATLRALAGPIEELARGASQHLSAVAASTSTFLGSALAVGDKVAGAAATAADLLPVYRFLGARLVAEVCLRRALAEQAEEQAAAEARSAAAVPIQYTRSAADLPDAPARRRGCFGLFLLLVIVPGALAAIADLAATAAWSVW